RPFSRGVPRTQNSCSSPPKRGKQSNNSSRSSGLNRGVPTHRRQVESLNIMDAPKVARPCEHRYGTAHGLRSPQIPHGPTPCFCWLRVGQLRFPTIKFASHSQGHLLKEVRVLHQVG